VAGGSRYSIVTPVFSPPRAAFESCVASVLAQTTRDWQWCLVDDASAEPWVADRLAELQASDARIETYRRARNGGIVAASNDALAMARGEFVVLLDHDDELSPDALAEVDAVIDREPLVDYVYSDEDKITPEGEHYDEFRKPRWSPERLRAQNYCSHVSVIRTALVDAVGRFREGFDGSQDHDLVLRVTERTRRIAHIPKVLYHWRAIPGSAAVHPGEKPHAFLTGLRAVREHLARTGIEAAVGEVPGHSLIRVQRTLRSRPEVAIVIPTRGTRRRVFGVDVCLVEHCVDAIWRNSTYDRYRIVVVADAPTPVEVLDRLTAAGDATVTVVGYDKPFNYSEKCNLGVVQGDEEFVVLLNDDTEIITPDWLEVMLAHMGDPDVAMVGPMLLLEDGRIQSAGHSYTLHHHNLANGLSSRELGPLGMLTFAREVSGVTGACAMVRRSAYFEVGGLSEAFPVSFNDVDLGYKLLDRGHRIIWTPLARLYHFESATREAAITPEELETLSRRWGSRFDRDEYTRVAWSLDAPALAPALAGARGAS
jgi:GT2 family glycosyltransferase